MRYIGLLLLPAVSLLAAERFIIVVPDNLVTPANNLCSRVHTNLYRNRFAGGGENTFIPSLGLTSTGPTTHAWCNWQFDNPADLAFLTNNGNGILNNPNVKIFNAATTTPDRVLIELGLVRVEAP